jgi:hypothetical protein
MTTRRSFARALIAGAVALGLMVVPAIAEELLGVLSKVDAENSKVTVIEKGTDKEVEVKITDDTELVTRKGAMKVELEKLERIVEKAKEKGRKGVNVKVEHEDGVAQKIHVIAKKKQADN